MSLANKRKYRRALHCLYEYLSCSTGIEHKDEWYGEVEVVREDVDPSDWPQFDDEVRTLEILSFRICRMWQMFNVEEAEYRKTLDTMYDKMWNETMVKKKAK